jgi:RNA polymerase sigma factor (sigma-70 family)
VASTDVPDPSAEPLRRWQEEGDPEALNRLLQIEIGVLKHMIHGRRHPKLAGSASTSDIAQEAVMGLLKTKEAPTFAEPRALRGYLWRSAWHLLVKRYEKQRGMPLRVELDETAGLDRMFQAVTSLRDMDRAERAMAIGIAMNVLAREDRELLRLVYFEEKDIEAAGTALGLSRGAANSRLVRARRLLAERLAGWADVIG